MTDVQFLGPSVHSRPVLEAVNADVVAKEVVDADAALLRRLPLHRRPGHRMEEVVAASSVKQS